MLFLPGWLRNVTVPQQPLRTLHGVSSLLASPAQMLVPHALHKNSAIPLGGAAVSAVLRFGDAEKGVALVN